MMLQDKVVVVAGVGSGPGRSVALASAREGADVVLAARTAARLDDVAKEIAGLGRRGLAVPTDLADAAAAEHLVTAAQDAFGRVDALVYSALAMPPIKELSAAWRYSRSTTRPRQPPTCAGCPSPTRSRTRWYSWPRRWPGRSPGSASTSTAASTTIELGY